MLHLCTCKATCACHVSADTRRALPGAGVTRVLLLAWHDRYTIYEVRVVLGGGQVFAVSKRYSDFVDLHLSLAAMYPLVPMPPIAEVCA